MRVITGTARGKKLVTAEGKEVRPTPERVKEALFSIIQFHIEGRRVLDLFAGSGQLGIEALSRGAREAVFVDASRKSIGLVTANLKNCGLEENAKVKCMDYGSFLIKENEPFDLAFLDPPYRTGILQEALPKTAGHMARGGVIVCENPSDEDMPSGAGDFVRVRSYRYGKVILTLYEHKDVLEQ